MLYNSKSDKLFFYLVIIVSMSLIFSSCRKTVNELGENSMVYRVDGKKVITVSKLFTPVPSGVSFTIFSDSLYIRIRNTDKDYQDLSIYVNNFHGVGTYNFSHILPPYNPNSTDNYVLFNDSNHNYTFVSTNNSNDGYLKILEYLPKQYIRGIFEFDLYNDQDDKVSITKGRFDWNIKNIN